MLRLRKLRSLCQEKERLQRKVYERHIKEIQKRIEETEKLKKHIAEATPEQLAALWKQGKISARDYNNRHPRQVVPNPSAQIFRGPRGGLYRINSQGRKVYDVW